MIPEIIEKFEYTDLERVTLESGVRHYVDPDGNNLPSVTTILSATSYKPELEEWKKRVGLEEAARITKEATNLGSLMHDNLEKTMLKEDINPKKNVIHKMANNMANVIVKNAFPKISVVYGMERVLYYPGLYAGTTDLVGQYELDDAIMDYKTTKKPKKREHIEDYSLQTAAYMLAHDETYGTKMKKGVIFMVSRDLAYQEFIWEGIELQNAKDEWLRRLEQYYKER